MFRDDGEKFQIFFAIIQDGMSTAFGAVVNHARSEDLLLAVAEGNALSGGDEDYFAGGFVAMFPHGVTGGKGAEEYLVVAICRYMGKEFAFAAFEAGQVLGGESVFCYQHGVSSIRIRKK